MWITISTDGAEAPHMTKALYYNDMCMEKHCFMYVSDSGKQHCEFMCWGCPIFRCKILLLHHLSKLMYLFQGLVNVPEDLTEGVK